MMNVIAELIYLFGVLLSLYFLGVIGMAITGTDIGDFTSVVWVVVFFYIVRDLSDRIKNKEQD